MTAADDAPTLFERLRGACGDEWRAYTRHAFVLRLGDGSLPEAAFRRYLVQDYLFLIHFARAHALAVFKSDTLDDMRQAAGGMAAILDEMGLHVRYCRRWGIGQDEIARQPEAAATVAYTRYVLERGLAGDLLDLHVALAPCIVGYAEIGAMLAARPGGRDEANPYADWIEMYAGEEYQQVARAHIEQLDRLMAARGGPARMAALTETFRVATRLETDFWQMGLDGA